jgi:hypothetical protein
VALTISRENGFILIESDSELNYWEILEVINSTFAFEGDKERHQIWNIQKSLTSLNYDDLHNLKRHILTYHMEASKKRKIAVVAGQGFNYAIAQTFIDIAADLPCDIRAFPQVQEAKEWIVNAEEPKNIPN